MIFAEIFQKPRKILEGNLRDDKNHFCSIELPTETHSKHLSVRWISVEKLKRAIMIEKAPRNGKSGFYVSQGLESFFISKCAFRSSKKTNPT